MYASAVEEIVDSSKQLALFIAEYIDKLTQEQSPNTRSRAYQKGKNFNCCWYYFRFGENPRARTPGCKRQGNTNENHHQRRGNTQWCTTFIRHLVHPFLKIAQDEFCKMIEQGVCQPSQSAWFSPSHLVEKKTMYGINPVTTDR